MRKAAATLILCTGLILPFAAAQTEITFWHSMATAKEAVEELAARFNASQDDWRVDAQHAGSYSEAQTRLAAAFGTPSAPVIFQAEVGYWPKLVQDGALHDLSSEVAELDQEFRDDFYPGLWEYGQLDGGHYGLPFNSSTPVLFYNRDALKAAGLEVPETWEEFGRTARALTSRQAQGTAFVGDPWLFESLVLSRGGQPVLDDGTPDFTSPETVAALEELQELQADDSLVFFHESETTAAILTFVRTRTLMVMASIANWPEVKRFSIGFDIAAAPLPLAEGGRVPLGGSLLSVLRTATPEQRAGAFAFWEFLMEPENVKYWVEESFYIPVRRAALPLLEDFYAEDPNRAAALSQLELAVPRPRTGDVTGTRRALLDAVELALQAGRPAADVLRDAQEKALELNR